MPEMTERLTLRKGESHIIVLPGLGSAGYVWTVLSTDQEIVLIEEIVIAAEEAPAVIQGSIDQRFRLTALAAGETVIRLAQIRRFAPQLPHDTREILLTIPQ
jgi:predicted secreted protein